MKTARLICWTGALFAALTFGQGKREAPTVRREGAVSPRLRELALRGHAVPVMIVLTEQPNREILSRNSRAAELARGGQPPAQRAQREDWNALEMAVRRSALAEIAPAIAPSQDAVTTLLLQAGSIVRRRYIAMNRIAAVVPAAALDRIASHPFVVEIFPLERHVPQLQSSVPALGAVTFWNAGFTGAGQSVAVLDTGVRRNHPAFAGLSISDHIFLETGAADPCFADNATSPEDQHSHGSHVAGWLRASQWNP